MHCIDVILQSRLETFFSILNANLNMLYTINQKAPTLKLFNICSSLTYLLSIFSNLFIELKDYRFNKQTKNNLKSIIKEIIQKKIIYKLDYIVSSIIYRITERDQQNLGLMIEIYKLCGAISALFLSEQNSSFLADFKPVFTCQLREVELVQAFSILSYGLFSDPGNLDPSTAMILPYFAATTVEIIKMLKYLSIISPESIYKITLDELKLSQLKNALLQILQIWLSTRSFGGLKGDILVIEILCLLQNLLKLGKKDLKWVNDLFYSIKHPSLTHLIIEIKSQALNGSESQKLATVCLNLARETSENLDAVIRSHSKQECLTRLNKPLKNKLEVESMF